MCGIAGVYNLPNAPEVTRLGLYQLQHRGQEWVGMVSSDGRNFYPHPAPLRAEGLVMLMVTDAVLRTMMGYMAMGHVRYSTQGASELNNAQPHQAVTSRGRIFWCSNGDIVNCDDLRHELAKHGFTFYSHNDGEIIVKLIAYYHRQANLVEAIRQAKQRLVGTFSGVLMARERMFLVRDHHENRPFCYTVSPGGAVYFASESVALDIMTADDQSFDGNDYEMQEVSGGEIIELSQGTITRHPDPRPADRPLAHCVFEPIYFSRPDSIIFGVSASEFRRRLARVIVAEARPEGDLVAPVPESGVEAATAVAEEMGRPYRKILFRHHDPTRTFIMPGQAKRDAGVKMKFNPHHRSVIAGRDIVLVDDSIVRGTTMRNIVGMLKRRKPRRLTLLITCPLIRHLCYYGIDMKGDLIAAKKDGKVETIKQAIGLGEEDQLHFLSLEGLRSCTDDASQWCFACLSGQYPTDIASYVPPRY